MSHFTVLVIGEDIEDKMAPYDEGLDVPPYIDQTKETLEKERLELIEEAKNPPQDSTPDYSVYTEDISLAEFAKVYHCAEVDSDGNLLTTYNPKSKWDWYVVGGRWAGMLTLESGDSCDQARLSMLNLVKKEFFTYAVITEDGRWHEMGRMGWWGCSSETEEERKEWIKTYWARFLVGLSEDALLTIVDGHI